MVFTKLLFKIEFKIRMASHIFIPLKKSILSQQIWNSITHLTTMLSGVWNTTWPAVDCSSPLFYIHWQHSRSCYPKKLLPFGSLLLFFHVVGFSKQKYDDFLLNLDFIYETNTYVLQMFLSLSKRHHKCYNKIDQFQDQNLH